MITGIEPRRIRMEFTYEADPLLTVEARAVPGLVLTSRPHIIQRLIIAIEPDDFVDIQHEGVGTDTALYVDIEAWGRRLTKSGNVDERCGFDIVYVSADKVRTFIDDAERRYRQLVVRP